MADIVLPEGILPAYICSACGISWKQDEPTKPWETHNLRSMPITGLDLRVNEVFGYYYDRARYSHVTGIVVISPPGISETNHHRTYATHGFQILQPLPPRNQLELKFSGTNLDSCFFEEEVSELTPEEFDLVLKLAKDSDLVFFKERPLSRGVLYK